MSNLILVGGTGRCGTKIAKAVLSLHSDICSLPFEWRFLTDPGGIVDFYAGITASWSPYIVNHKLNHLEKLLRSLANPDSEPYAGWDLDQHIPGYSHHVSGLLPFIKGPLYSCKWHGSELPAYRTPYMGKEALAVILGGFVTNIVESLSKKHNADIVMSDETWSILFAKELLEIMPTMKLIHIYRDPRDVVDSMTHQRWCPDDHHSAAMFYKSIMDRWIEVRKYIPSDRFIEVSLESLINDTLGTLSMLCYHIGVKYEEQMTAIDLSKGNIGRWEKGFAGNEAVLPILEPYVQMLGYS